AGDLLVANGSATLAASLQAHGPAGTYTLDLSTRYADRLWLAEPRWDSAHPGPMPIQPGEEARLDGATVRYVAPYPGIPRLWFLRSDVCCLEVESSSVEHQVVQRGSCQVSRDTAELVNRTREGGPRVVAMGATVVRALESGRPLGGLGARQVFTRLFVHPGNPVR